MISKEFYKELEEFIENLPDKKDDVKILNFVVEKLDSIPKEVQRFIANKTGILEISIENTINFYPKFRNKVSDLKEVIICTGMICGQMNGHKIYKELMEMLEVDSNGISKNRKIILLTKRCLGRCKKAPNISIDGEIYSLVNLKNIKKILGL